MNRDPKRDVTHEERRSGDPAEAVPAGGMPKRERTSAPQFLREVRSELKKVAWPNRQEVMSYTVVVLVTTLVLVLFVFGLDTLFREAVFNLF